MFNLASILERNAARHPNEIAVSEGDREVTHAELDARVDAVAAALRSTGLGDGDIIAVLLYNRIEFLEIMFAANRIGAAIMPMNYRLSPAEWSYLLQHSGARAVLTEVEFASRIDDLDDLPELLHKITVDGDPGADWLGYAQLVEGADLKSVPLAEVAGEQLQRLMYTSGTTSRPKGVMLTHTNVIWKNLAHIIEFGLTAGDNTLVCGPLYHVGGMDLPALATLHAGGRLSLIRKFDAQRVVEHIERLRPTNIWLAPSMMNAILELPNIDEIDTSSLRFITGGGEKMPIPLLDRVERAFPTSWFADAYGLTETVSGDTINDREHMRSKVGSVGRPVAHVDVRIVDDAGEFVGADEIGEIVVRGPKVMGGYWRDEAATARAIRNGWFHTGDVGRIDQDGFLYIEDRKKDMIVSGGENIATPEVERVLYEHPDVVEAAVIGIPDERWGEVPKAFIVLRADSTTEAADIISFCRGRLAKYKAPAQVSCISALPRTPSGKVLKRQLRDGILS